MAIIKCVAIVPMKLNNSRLPGKNTRPFTDGEPLCHYILDTLLKVDLLDGIYVYCSDPSIKEHLPDGVRYLERPASLDTDSTKINDVLSSFANEIESDIYLLAHTTAPFISRESLEEGLDAVISGRYDSSFSVVRTQDFMWDEHGPINYALDAIPRTQDLEPVYVETCGFYCYTRDLILSENRRIGHNPKKVVVSKIESIDIDDMEDFVIADSVFNLVFKQRRLHGCCHRV